MKERVKIFTAGDRPEGFPHLEEQINAWLDEHPNIEITHRMMSAATGHSIARATQNHDDGNYANITIVLSYRNKS